MSFVHFSRSWLGMRGGLETLARRSPELRDWERGWPCPGVLRVPGARARERWRVVQHSPSTILKFFILNQIIQLAPLRGFVTPNLPSFPSWAGRGTGARGATTPSIVVNWLPLWSALGFWL